MAFEDTAEYKQSIAMQPACTKAFMDAFQIPESNIIRYDKGSNNLHILDVNFHIDGKIILLNKSAITMQEKALSNKYYKYKTFTMEFYQNRYTKELGEFFKIASQIYLHGYSDTSGVNFIEYHIIKVYDFIAWMNQTFTIEWLENNMRNAAGSRATFINIPYSQIPQSIFMFNFYATKQ